MKTANTIRFLLLWAGIGLMANAAATNAVIYKYRDSAGRIVYTDDPTEVPGTVQTIPIAPPPPAERIAAAKARHEQIKAFADELEQSRRQREEARRRAQAALPPSEVIADMNLMEVNIENRWFTPVIHPHADPAPSPTPPEPKPWYFSGRHHHPLDIYQ